MCMDFINNVALNLFFSFMIYGFLFVVFYFILSRLVFRL
uniref:Uncharacterized protein n=1 Tax=Rhizophora mucronata TaxID=61149 RepID=A0A2P2PUJ5_RHIMU